jgi:DNA-binding NtrC family response regulator
LFETADGGTLFLDEIADLPMQSQVKLLRALQSGEIKPVGSDGTKLVDVRVVAATNADLRKRVDEGRFREDLYYRLNVVAIHLPPLRKRQDDIPLLAYHFLNKYARRNRRDVKTITPEAMGLLRDQPWKGNVRELENAMEHAVVLARTEAVGPDDLPFINVWPDTEPSTEVDRTFSSAPPMALPADVIEQSFTEARKRVLQMFEKTYVESMLVRTAGNISEAARLSGLDRSNFRRVLKKNKSDPDP